MHLGAGSRNSPIFISDDEGDAFSPEIEILSVPATLKTPTIPIQAPQGPKSKRALRNANKAAKQQPAVETSSKKRKRKREQSNAPGPSHVSSGVIVSGSNKNKKLKQERPGRSHREKDLRRFEMGGDFYGGESYLAPPIPSLPPRPFTNSIENKTAPPAYYSFPSADEHDDNDGDDSPLLSSSEWVNSMARAAKPPEQEVHPWQHASKYTSPPPQTYALEQPLEPLPSDPSPSSSTSTINNSLPTPSSLPSKKTAPSNIIGMPVEKDTDGRRGSFKITSSTIFDGQPDISFPHIPNSSNTLILEQLPRTHRTPSFIQSWCENACGSPPIFFAIEPSAAKALLEFPTAALAKKAWGSPKLGKGLLSLNSVQLKGKPREDLIRVWWYHPSSPELRFTRKELEEGEIEDETGLDDGAPKETKKERKARLAKIAKEEKARKREKALAAAAVLQKEKSAAKDQAALALASSSLSMTSLPSSYSSEFFDPSVTPVSSPTYMPMSYSVNAMQPPSLSASWTVPVAMSGFIPPMPTTIPPPLPPPPEYQSHWDNWNVLSQDVYANLDDGSQDQFFEDDRMDIEDVDMDLSSPIATTHSIPPQPHENTITIDLANSSPPFTEISLPVPVISRPSTVSSDSQRGFPTSTPRSPNEQLGSEIAANSTAFPPLPAPPLLSAPSEPRAMKNAPREPSFAKRSLLARKKELEEQILKSKLELERKGQQQAVKSAPAECAPTPSASSMATTSSQVPKTVEVSPSKHELEENLRQLVLASQKRRKAAAGVNDASRPVTSTATTSAAESTDIGLKSSTSKITSAETPVSSTELVETSVETSVKSSLDDLAVSFINETFQILQPVSAVPLTPVSTPTPAPLRAPKPVPSSLTSAPIKPVSSSSSLTAKRLQLEQQIAETKKLMDKLSKATTKQERDDILARIREISRNSQDDVSSVPSTPSPPVPAAASYPSFLTAHVKSPWPESILDGGILILSDDEDEDMEDM